MKKPRAIDLFSGAGGLTQGLKEAGFAVIGAVEFDSRAAGTYRANHPSCQLFEGDINALEPSDVLQVLGLRKGELDLLAGCPPCQGFSRMRNHNGGRIVRDPLKKDLVLRFADYVEALLPKTVMMENVPGLEKDWRFTQMKAELRELGYHISLSEVRDAQHFGVPQRRKRLILVASRVGEMRFQDTPGVQCTVRESISFLRKAGSSGDPLHDAPEKRAPRVVALIRDIPKDGGSRTDLPRARQLPCHKRLNGFKDVYGRMSWDKVAPTITGGCFNPSKGRFLHPEEDRSITLREAALLQTFPANYIFPGPINKQAIALMIGNALPPKFIRHHAQVIKRALMRDNRIR